LIRETSTAVFIQTGWCLCSGKLLAAEWQWQSPE